MKEKVINVWNALGTVLWGIFFALVLLRVFVYQNVNVVGSSMEPSYQSDHMLVVNRLQKENLERGQVVAVYEDKEVARDANFLTPYSAKFFLKRVIGLPGECIELFEDKIIIADSNCENPLVLNEPYIGSFVKSQETRTEYYFPQTKIPNDSYFLLGDNRINSIDSREKGPFPIFSIFGAEQFRYWPLSAVNTFTLPVYEFAEIDSNFNTRLEQAREQYALRNGTTL